MMQTKKECSQDKNQKSCTCSYPGCSRKGICCECLKYHQEKDELPGCLFPPEAEKTYDRSIGNFIRVWKDKVS